jgi:superfamily II DNA/RNA helicase
MNLEQLASAFLQRRFVRCRRAASRVNDGASPLRYTTDNEIELDMQQLVASATAVATAGVGEAASFLLSGDTERFTAAEEDLALAHEAMLSFGVARPASLLDGIRGLLPRLNARSTWTLLNPLLQDNRLWERYLAVLARGIGEGGVLNARSISELWPSQVAAVDGGLLEPGAAHIVRMPTSAGKTRIAELSVVHTLATKPVSRCLYVAPFRALAAEVEASFAQVFGDLGLGVATLTGTFETNPLVQELTIEDDILIVTPEKLDQLLRQSPETLDAIALVVLDEGHIVADQRRGPKYEMVMTRLRRRLPNAQFLVLSAVVPDRTLEDFAAWLGGDPQRPLTSQWRPTTLRLARLDWDGSRGDLVYPDEPSPTQLRDGSDAPPAGLTVPAVVQAEVLEHVWPSTGRVRRPTFPEPNHRAQLAAALTWQLVDDGPVLIFCAAPDAVTSVARALLNRHAIAEARQEVPPAALATRESRAAVVAEEWLGAQHPVTLGLRRGIGVHYSALPDAVRSAIEQDFRDRQLAVLAATSTLAQGVNLPVRTVIVQSTRRYDSELSQRILMPARDFWNIAGRVGRAGAETEGTVIFLSFNGDDEADFEHFRAHRSDVEPVRSALLQLLDELVEGRISDVDLAKRLDPEMLAILVEEADSAVTVSGLKELLGGSLFAIQALAPDAGPPERIDALWETMARTSQVIAQGVADVERRRLFASTGLSAVTCMKLHQHVESHAPNLRAAISSAADGDRGPLLDLLLSVLPATREMEPGPGFSGSYRDLIDAWLEGASVSDLASAFEAEPVALARFIEDFFGYKLPWGISGYLKILSAVLEFESLPEAVQALPVTVRYGVPNQVAAWAMTLGIPSRRVAAQLAALFLATDWTVTASSLRRWLGQLDPDALSDELGISGPALEQTARVAMRAQRNDLLREYYADGTLSPLSVTITTSRTARLGAHTAGITAGTQLGLRRDYDSALNRNALLLIHAGYAIARLPRPIAQAIALYIDSGAEYFANVTKVSNVDENGQPSSLIVSISKV